MMYKVDAIRVSERENIGDLFKGNRVVISCQTVKMINIFLYQRGHEEFCVVNLCDGSSSKFRIPWSKF